MYTYYEPDAPSFFRYGYIGVINDLVTQLNNGPAPSGGSWFDTYTEVTLDNTTPYDWDGSTYELRITTDGSGPINAVIHFTGTPAVGTPYLFTLVSQGDPGDTVTFDNVPALIIAPNGILLDVAINLSAEGAKVYALVRFLSDPDFVMIAEEYDDNSIILNSSDNIYRPEYSGSGVAHLVISPPGPFSPAFSILKLTSDGSGTPNQILSMDIADKAGIYKIEFENQADPSDTIELYPNTAFVSVEGTVGAVVLDSVGAAVFIQGGGNTWQLLSYSGGGIVITPYPSGTFEAVGGQMLTFTAGVLTGVA